jgi:predicted fused transcriptional regulator/phosphomethylpyrimidine kinase
LVCIYRSPYSDVHIFLEKLEILADIIHKKRKKKIIICGDWNVNLLQENKQVQALNNLLAFHDVINRVTSLTRVTNRSDSFLDVMVTNRQLNKNIIEVVNMGHSDHLAQILWMSVDKDNEELEKVLQRKYTKENVDKFINMLTRESWEGIHVERDENGKNKQFIKKVLGLL